MFWPTLETIISIFSVEPVAGSTRIQFWFLKFWHLKCAIVLKETGKGPEIYKSFLLCVSLPVEEKKKKPTKLLKILCTLVSLCFNQRYIQCTDVDVEGAVHESFQEIETFM